MKKSLIALGTAALVVAPTAACGSQPQYQAVCVNPFTHAYLDAVLFCHGGFGQFVYVPYNGGYMNYQPNQIVVHYVAESQVRSSRVQYPAKFTPSPGQRLVGKKITVYDPANKSGTELKKSGNNYVVKPAKKTTPAYGTPPDPKRVTSRVQDKPRIYKAPSVSTRRK